MITRLPSPSYHWSNISVISQSWGVGSLPGVPWAVFAAVPVHRLQWKWPRWVPCCTQFLWQGQVPVVSRTGVQLVGLEECWWKRPRATQQSAKPVIKNTLLFDITNKHVTPHYTCWPIRFQGPTGECDGLDWKVRIQAMKGRIRTMLGSGRNYRNWVRHGTLLQ